MDLLVGYASPRLQKVTLSIAFHKESPLKTAAWDGEAGLHRWPKAAGKDLKPLNIEGM